MELDYTQITAVLSYKKGWFYTYEPGNGGKPYTTGVRDKVVIHAEVEDSRDPGTRVKFMMRRVIPNVVRNDQRMFIDWVHDITIEAEMHEVNEFFRFAGELLYDPHKTVRVNE
jgi:hypothetical protein